jgi:hypothetical protein
VSVESLVELGDVRVAKLLNDFDLSFDSLPPVWFKEFELLVDLTSYLLLGFFVETDAYHCIGSLPNSFPNDIVVKVIRGTALCSELILLLRQRRVQAIILLLLAPSWRASGVIRGAIVCLVFFMISWLVITLCLHFVCIIINVFLPLEKRIIIKCIIHAVYSPCASLCVVK